MVVIAVMAVISAIAVPAYVGYIREAKLSTAHANADSLRIFLEDHQLDNSTYVASGDVSGTTYSKSDLASKFNWTPSGDGDLYTYSVTVTPTTWSITVQHDDGEWIRCEDRMNTCCDMDTSGATTSACP